jgi:hypothetical protein
LVPDKLAFMPTTSLRETLIWLGRGPAPTNEPFVPCAATRVTERRN